MERSCVMTRVPVVLGSWRCRWRLNGWCEHTVSLTLQKDRGGHGDEHHHHDDPEDPQEHLPDGDLRRSSDRSGPRTPPAPPPPPRTRWARTMVERVLSSSASAPRTRVSRSDAFCTCGLSQAKFQRWDNKCGVKFVTSAPAVSRGGLAAGCIYPFIFKPNFYKPLGSKSSTKTPVEVDFYFYFLHE